MSNEGNTLDVASLGVEGTVTALNVQGAAATMTESEGVLTITDATRGEYMDVVAETATHVYTIPNVTIVDLAIANAEDLAAKRATNIKNEYYIVTESFDATGVTLANWLEYSTINGRGNTINGTKCGLGATSAPEYGNIYNLGLTNVDVTNGPVMYVVRAGVMQNCYVHVADMYHTSSGPTYALKTDREGEIIDTVFVVTEGTRWPGTWSAIPAATTGSYENVYLTYPQLSDATYTGITTYNSVADFNAAAETVKATLGDDWTIYNGSLMFKTATQFMAPATIAFEESSEEIEQGATVTYTATGATKYALATEVEGVSIDATTGAVTVAETVEVGTTITVNAYITTEMYGELVGATKTVTVIAPVAAE